jgi:hypothetical protein
MASFPAIVREWADRHQLDYDASALESALSVITQAGDFESTKSRLFAKLSSSSGYNTARQHVHARLLKILSDPSTVRNAFHQSLGIREAGTKVVHRTQLNKLLDAWWDASGVPQPLVVVGEEGTGKTWAVFDWAIGRLESAHMPILLPVAAVSDQVVKGDSAEIIVSRLLAKWTGLLDENRWERRLNRWFSANVTGRPLILLIVDGLNERANLDWRPFLSTLTTNPWRQNVASLATDRPHHWHTKCSRAGVASFDVITLNGYSQGELDRALTANHLSHKDIPDGLLPLVSIPRYCSLVAKHYKEMITTGDFTSERLIYLEVKDRQSSKLQYPLTDAQLFEIIRDLAERARVNPELKSKDLIPLIAVPGGDEANIYEEIVSGGLLVPVPRMTESFRVEPLRLVYGFGMLLAEELAQRPSASSNELEEFLTSWFEPQPDMDRKVDICGSAMFHALFQDDFPERPLHELIRYWLGLRNWADTAQLAFTGFVLHRPKVFLEVAEDFWSSLHDNGAAQEFLGAALVTHRNDGALQPLLVSTIERWMGFIHPLGRHFRIFDAERIERMRKSTEAQTGEKVMTPADETAKEERFRQQIEARAGCQLIPGDVEVAGIKLTVVLDGDLLRLARFGLMLISAGDPSPFTNSLVHWAVASAVMGHADFSDLVSWVVRLSNIQIDDVLLGQARHLLSRKEAVASDAARILLLTIGTRESESLIEKHGLTPEWYREQRAQHVSDPCKSYFEWTESETITCLGRDDVPLHILLERGVLSIVDPLFTLPATLLQRAKDALQLINPALIRAGSYNTIEGHNLETLTQVLCVHAPSEMAEFLRAVVRTMPDRDLTGQYSIAVQIPEISLLLKTREVIAVSSTVANLSSDATDWSDKDQGPRHTKKIAEARAFSGIAPHLSRSDFFQRFIARSANALDVVGLELWFGPVPKEDAQEVGRLLRVSPDQATLRRLLWILPSLGYPLLESDRKRLLTLAESTETGSRAGAMRVAAMTQDEDLGRSMVDLGRFVTKETGHWEEQWLTYLLVRFGAHLSFEDLAKRLRPSAIGFAITERGNRPEEIETYADCLDKECQRIMAAANPELDCLPEIIIDNDPSGSGTSLPQLHEPDTSGTIRLDPSGSWRSGPPTDPGDELKKFFSRDYEKEIQELNEDRHRKIDAILAAWRTDAFQWYGRTFKLEVIDLVYQRRATLVGRWIQPALDDAPQGLTLRVRYGTFLDPICRVLLNRNPQLGIELWRTLHDRQSSPIVFDTTDIALSAEDSTETKLVRQVIVDECWNDAAIAKVAVVSNRWNRQTWLEETIAGLISAERLWKRAKGLALASFSDITTERFEELVSRAKIERTWVEQSLRSLRENVRKNRLARHWYAVFLNSEDSDAAWGALQIVLAHADERLLNWCTEVEKECTERETSEKRLRFLALGWQSRRDLRKKLDRDGERRERLFGLKIQRGEIVPFMP